MTLKQALASAGLAGIVANFAACSADSTDRDGEPLGRAHPVGGGAGGFTSSGLAGQSASGATNPIDVSAQPPLDLGSGMSPTDSCAGIELEPETILWKEPIAMYLMLDNSKSMIEGKAPLKWDQAVKAFNDFIDDPRSEGIDFGIQYFHPQPPPGWVPMPVDPFNESDDDFRYRPDECDGVAHSQSAVPVGQLPNISQAIKDSLAAGDPRSNTPTVGALKGGVDFCTKFRQEHNGQECIVVFVTDGQPNGCGLSLKCHPGFTPNHKGDCVDPTSEGVLTPIVKTGFEQHGVKTYTVGMEGVIADGFDLLDALARAGGTDCTPNAPGKEACDVTATGGAGLLEALSLIRETIVKTSLVPCNLHLPAAPDGKRLDPRLVNVELKVRGEDVRLKQVLAKDECGKVEGGWYYDNPLTPAEIRTCPQTCKVIDDNAEHVRVVVRFGCATDTVPR